MPPQVERGRTIGIVVWRRARCGRARRAAAAALTAVLAGGALVVPPAPIRAATVPDGFRDTVAISGLTDPTAVRFARDGRIFVGEKSGLIKVFDGLSDATPTVFADLRTNVFNGWDRGLLGLALDPDFPTSPFVYVLYTHDAEIGAPGPRWGAAGASSDPCPDPPGINTNGCVVSGRLSRLRAAGDVMTGGEQVLVEDWCQQYPSHSVGSLAFGPDGALYASGGDGASFTFTDYGQKGDPPNPCGDPPAGVGGAQTIPSAEGGALRSQDLRTSADAVTLDGTIIRVDPATGAALANNPLYRHPDANGRRVVAYGLRNPFRFAIRPGSDDLYIGDVGYRAREEINRVGDPTDATAENFGWPCYEGGGRQPAYDAADLAMCENLYAEPTAVNAPFHSYSHSEKVVAGESCPTGGSSITGLAFAPEAGSPYPDEYDGALFFADYSRDCIWAMLKGADGLPDPSNIRTFVAQASNPVELQVSPSGELFYVDLSGGAIHRIGYAAANRPPLASAGASPTDGRAPLTVSFDGTSSSDPDGDALSYAWDLDGDGAFDDSSEARTTITYEREGTYWVRLQVIDAGGASDVSDAIAISVGNSSPVASIDAPPSSTTWSAGEVVEFTGSGTDAEDGALDASRLSWSLILHHCPSNCHAHVVQNFPEVASGSFATPDHDYPSHLELRLTATDSGGLAATDNRLLHPRTVDLDFDSTPRGLALAVGGATGTTPFVRRVIVGSTVSVSALSPQSSNGATYTFSSWSDGGAQTHDVIAPETAAAYRATYVSSGGFALSNVRTTDITRTSAFVRWSTTESSDSRVKYGRTSSYGFVKRVGGMVTEHAVQLTRLRPNTLYHYRARSRNAAGVLRSSPDLTFRTRA